MLFPPVASINQNTSLKTGNRSEKNIAMRADPHQDGGATGDGWCSRGPALFQFANQAADVQLKTPITATLARLVIRVSVARVHESLFERIGVNQDLQ